MRRSSFLYVVILAIVLVTVPQALAGQTGSTFTFRGSVVDTTGAAIPGAAVLVDADAKPVATSDASGAFAVALAPGRHQITISSPGFEPLAVAVVAAGASGS